MGVGITGRKNGKIIQAVTIMTLGLPLANTMMKKRIKILFFFCVNCLLTSQPQCGIIVVGVRRAGNECGGPTFRSDTPYAKFSRLLATFHIRQIFPETAGGRSVRHMRQRALEFNRHMTLQRYLKCPEITSCEFR